MKRIVLMIFALFGFLMLSGNLLAVRQQRDSTAPRIRCC